jgi:hypothetical protein
LGYRREYLHTFTYIHTLLYHFPVHFFITQSKVDGTEIFRSRFDVVAYLTDVCHMSCSYCSEVRIVTNFYLNVCIKGRSLSIKNYSLPGGADEIHEVT